MEYISIERIKTFPEFEKRLLSPDEKLNERYFVTKLTDSIVNVGRLVEPLSVIKNGNGNDVLLIDGYKRLLVLKALGEKGILPKNISLDNIPIEFLPDSVQHEKPEVLRAALNIVSVPITPSLAGETIRILIKKFHCKKSHLAHVMGISMYEINRYFQIEKCIKEVRDAIDNKIFSIYAAKTFRLFKEKGQRILYARYMKSKNRHSKNILEKLSKKIPDSLAFKPLKKRIERSARAHKLIKKNKKHKTYTNLQETKAILSDNLLTKEKDLEFLQKECSEYSKNLRATLSEVEVWLRTDDIKKYLQNKYPEMFKNIKKLISKELGIEVKI